MKPETDGEWVQLLRDARETEIRADERLAQATARARDAERGLEDAQNLLSQAEGAYYDTMKKFRAWLGIR